MGGLTTQNYVANGNYEIFIFIAATTAGLIAFLSVLAGDTFDLDNVSVKEMSSIALNIKDLDGNSRYSENDGTSITYHEDRTALQTDTQDTKAMICIDWTQVVVGDCYQVCIIDEALEGGEFVVNGTFNNASNWVLGLGWTIAGGDLSIDSTVVAGDGTGATGDLTSNLQVGEKYTLTFDGANLVGAVQVFVILTDLSNKLIGLVANGANSLEIDMTTETLQGTKIVFAEDDSGPHAIDIDNVSILKQNASKNATFETECFKLETDFSCSKLFTWTNDENAFGLNYINFTFTQVFRHCAKLWRPTYDRVKTTHRDSSGDRAILYSSTTKTRRLTIDQVPEYIHDAIAIGLEHDTFTIDTVEYVHEEEEYEPNWRKSSLLAYSDVEVIEDDQNLVNDNC